MVEALYLLAVSFHFKGLNVLLGDIFLTAGKRPDVVFLGEEKRVSTNYKTPV
jgi:hypothetical protein